MTDTGDPEENRLVNYVFVTMALIVLIIIAGMFLCSCSGKFAAELHAIPEIAKTMERAA